MQVKRSRVARSSSFDETGLLSVLNQPSTPQSSALRRELSTATKILRTSPRSPPGIMTLSSPEIVKESCHSQVGNFLETCHFCKKRILQKSEVFMYGSLRGFCSPECRGKQIAIDNALERIAKQLRGKGTECSRRNDAKGQSGF